VDDPAFGVKQDAVPGRLRSFGLMQALKASTLASVLSCAARPCVYADLMSLCILTFTKNGLRGESGIPT
jgi:hypothetical protein